MVECSSSLLVSGLGEKKAEADGCRNGGSNGVTINGSSEVGDSAPIEGKEYEKPHEDAGGEQVFVSQVAAAVAALHERSFLEERIRAFRFAQPSSKSQFLEHSNISSRASEEREKRSNCRPLLEHDSLLSQQTQSQVLRDIIEEHMEEIKQAGRIGYSVKASLDNVHNSQRNTRSSTPADIYELSSTFYDPSEANRKSSSYRISPNRDVRYDKYEHQYDRKSARHDDSNAYESESSLAQESRSHLHRHRIPQSKQNDVKVSKFSSHGSKDHKSRSYSMSRLANRDTDCMPEYRADRSSTHGSCRPFSVIQDAFDDRYDPTVISEEYDASYDDSTTGSYYVGSDKFHCTKSKEQYHDQVRGDRHKGRQYHDNKWAVSFKGLVLLY